MVFDESKCLPPRYELCFEDAPEVIPLSSNSMKSTAGFTKATVKVNRRVTATDHFQVGSIPFLLI